MGVKSVKALRSFYYSGKLIKAGDVVTLPAMFAIEVIAANKAVAEEIRPEVKVEVKETPIESAGSSVKAQRKAGKSDVG